MLETLFILKRVKMELNRYKVVVLECHRSQMQIQGIQKAEATCLQFKLVQKLLVIYQKEVTLIKNMIWMLSSY